MRGARWLLLVVMVAIIGAVGYTYNARKRSIHNSALPKPAALPAELNFSAENYHFRKTGSDNRPMVEIQARDFKQVKDSSRVELTGLELKLYQKHGDGYDLVKSDTATFFASENRLYSDGDVEITLGVPENGDPPPNLVSIHATGVNFDTNSGKATTDRPATFTFRNGDGKATGASYDPESHELRMYKDVEVHWMPPGEHAVPIKIEASMLIYHEAQSEIWLKPWGRFTRQNTIVEGYDTVVHLQDKAIRQIETNRAQGTDTYPDRKLQYAADGLWVDMNDDGEVEKMRGVGNARLVSTSDTSETAMTAGQVEMFFDTQSHESVLSRVNAAGNSAVTSKPVPAAGRQPGETHILRSETIDLTMHAGGREIESVRTHGPGNLEFLPNLPSQQHRTLSGNDLVIAYAADNQIESFRATGVKTQTDPSADERRRNGAIVRTASREMLARFQPNSSQLASMEQTGDFTYEAGQRHARAAKATLNAEQNVMVLDTGARVWDESGATSADRIRLDERTGNFVAEGSVNSSRLPEHGGRDSGMLASDELLQAQAQRMESANRNRSVHYEGGVNLWQGANRIQGNVVDIDREKQVLVADGKVVTNLWEQHDDSDKDQKKKSTGPPVLTVVHSDHLVYTDQNRLATYTGGVVLTRPGLQVKAREIRSFLAEAKAESRLEKAFAEGKVEIMQHGVDRTRTGTAEHGEYYPSDQKVILRGGQPQLVDSLKGATHGSELTYYANDDRVVASGSADQQTKTRIQRK